MTDASQPSLVQHARLQQALDAWAERKDAQTHSDALRRAMSGQLLLDISASTFADPDNPMQQGDTLAVASVRDADGKAVTSIRGVLVAGEACQPSDFYGGQETFDNLVAKGFVVTR
jgi:hypothetical protein